MPQVETPRLRRIWPVDGTLRVALARYKSGIRRRNCLSAFGFVLLVELIDSAKEFNPSESFGHCQFG